MSIEIQGLCPLIQVFDMPRALHFYRDILGFEVIGCSAPGDDCDWAWLRRNGAELMLNTAYERDVRPERADRVREAIHDDTRLYIGCPSVDEAYEYLKSRGLDVKPPKNAPYGMRQLNLRDPDGYGITFQWPVQPDDEQLTR